MPIGAEAQKTGGVHFRVWAPRRKLVEVILGGRLDDYVLPDARPGADGSSDKIKEADKSEGTAIWKEGTRPKKAYRLEREGSSGYFSGFIDEASTKTLYRFRLDGDDLLVFPDSASRYQPFGPHGPSLVVDPKGFAWSDSGWRGVNGLMGQVIYEMHIGTFTRDGAWASARERLDELKDLGITVLEVMPVSEFGGEFGWGYDGVDLYAPYHHYGSPDDFRGFVDYAHSIGLGVILDVVYNHLGPDGCYLDQFDKDYFTDRYQCEWGKALNFDGPGKEGSREFFVENAAYWIREFHLDGLRLDATQQIFDSSSTHVIEELILGARKTAEAVGRKIVIVAENEPQRSYLARRSSEPEASSPRGDRQEGQPRRGCGVDGLWNDDFHHAAKIALTGHKEAYFSDYSGTPQELISAAKWGYLYQGQYYSWQKKRRGSPGLDLHPSAFISFIQNHDQIANSARGLRIHQLTTLGRYRAMTALFILMPGTPMFLQGQEFAASTPFLYFADHDPELAQAVRKGREEFLSQFETIASKEIRSSLAAPEERETFLACKLDHAEKLSAAHEQALRLHRDLLQLRRSERVIAQARRGSVDGAVLGPEALLLRFFSPEASPLSGSPTRGAQESDGGTSLEAFLEERLLVVNLGRDLDLSHSPEPLLAPSEGAQGWEMIWSSEDPTYGGLGSFSPESPAGWKLLGHWAGLLRPRRPDSDR